MRATKLREINTESIAFRRLSRVFAESPESVLQELVDTAVDFCGATAPASLWKNLKMARFGGSWSLAVFPQYLGGRTRRNYSPCGTCLDLSRAQLYCVTEPY